MAIVEHRFGPFLGEDGQYILAAGHADPAEFWAWASEQYRGVIDPDGLDEVATQDEIEYLHATPNTVNVHGYDPGEWVWLHTDPGPASEPVTVLVLDGSPITQKLPPAREDFNVPGAAALEPPMPTLPPRPEDHDGVRRVVVD